MPYTRSCWGKYSRVHGNHTVQEGTSYTSRNSVVATLQQARLRTKGAQAVVVAIWSLLLVSGTQALAWVSPNPQGVYQPDQFGVAKAHLTGRIELQNGSKVQVFALVYLKAILNENGVRLRGQAWFLDTSSLNLDVMTHKDASKQLLLSLSVAEFMTNISRLPIFFIRPYDTDRADHHKMKIVLPDTASDIHEEVDREHLVYKFQEGLYTSRLPFNFEGMLKEMDPIKNVTGTFMYKLCISDWIECAPLALRSMIQDSLPIHQQAQQHTDYTILSVMNPLFGMPAGLLSELLYYHTKFHLKIGLNATLVYDRGDHTSQLLFHPALQQLVSDNQLMFMKWTYNHGGTTVPKQSTLWWKYYDQPVVYSHAALSFWGLKTYLLFVDLDEYIKVPPETTLRSQMSSGGCLNNLAYMQFNRENYHCQPGGLKTPAGHALKYFPLLTCNKTPAYGWFDWPKSMALADAVASFFVHDGFLFPGFRDHAMVVPMDCAEVVHLKNLAHETPLPVEAVKTNNITYDDSWMWPLLEVKQDLEREQRNGGDLKSIRPLSMNGDNPQ